MATPWAMGTGDLVTRWAADVDPEAPLPEHPRPQFARPDAWLNLNGLWEYVVQDAAHGRPAFDPDRRILVPFAIESALSGVKAALSPAERLWYRRAVHVPADWAGRRVLLHFGAVDFEAEVFVNGHLVGGHRGGYTPFTFDITDRLSGAETELVVAVHDPTDHERGKQTLDPEGLSYTSVSGIWQTVWLEAVGERFIGDIALRTSFADSTIAVGVAVGDATGLDLEVVVSADGREVARGSTAAGDDLVLEVPDARPWSPDDPFLYDLVLRLREGAEVLDEVTSYTGIRSFGIERTPDGHRRFFLNGAPIFHHGVLDQGYWPDGLYTAPTDEALAFDVQLLKDLGFNMARKHVKIESARWYHHCDRLGLLVWQDMPSGGHASPALMKMIMGVVRVLGFLRQDIWGPFGTWVFRHGVWRIREDRTGGGGRTPAQRQLFETQLHAMLDALGNAPSIAVWVPFNEGWGQYDSVRIARDIARRDPTRAVDHASGWSDQLVGDIVSYHDYATTQRLPARRRIRDRVLALSEYGGLNHVPAGHTWRDEPPALYHTYDDAGEMRRTYESLLEQLRQLSVRGLSAAVLTQLSDIELEMNGLVSYDRAVVKVDADRSAALGRALTTRA